MRVLIDIYNIGYYIFLICGLRPHGVRGPPWSPGTLHYEVCEGGSYAADDCIIRQFSRRRERHVNQLLPSRQSADIERDEREESFTLHRYTSEFNRKLLLLTPSKI